MVALQIVRRDLIRCVRSPLRTGLIFAIPLALAAIFAIVFGGGGSDEISIKVLVYDEDQGLVSRMLSGSAGSDQVDPRLDLELVGADGYEMMDQGLASALVHIPPGFSQAYLDGIPVTLGVVKNPAQRFLPLVVEEGAFIAAAVLSQASAVFRTELEQLSGMLGAQAFPTDLAVSAMSVGVTSKLRQVETYLLPPVIELERLTLGDEGEASSDTDLNILSYFLPGLSLMGILFLAQASTRDILLERESGLLRHLLTAPVTPWQYLVGKCLSVLLLTVLGFSLLVVVGLGFGVSWGPPAAAAALVLASAIAASGTLLLIMSLVGSQRQGDALTTIVIIVWSLVGGAFVPVSQIPTFLQPLSRTTLTYWAADGFNTIIVAGGSLADVVVNLSVLCGAGTAFLLLGAAMLRRRMTTGAV